MEDHEALINLRKGDLSGLKHLVGRYQTEAVRAAFLITHDRTLSDDIVQDAFLRVVDRVAQFDLTRTFRPWFLRIVVNMSIKAVSRGLHPISLDNPRGLADGRPLMEDIPAPGADMESEIETEELREAMWDAMNRLSPSQRATVVMRYFLDMSEAEMVEAIGRAPGTIKWHLHQARTRLRDLLAGIGWR